MAHTEHDNHNEHKNTHASHVETHHETHAHSVSEIAGVPETLTKDWTQSHLDMTKALSAYAEALDPRNKNFKETTFWGNPLKTLTLRNKHIKADASQIDKSQRAFPLSEGEVEATLTQLPSSWIKASDLEKIQFKAPALFVTMDYKNDGKPIHFVAGAQIQKGDHYIYEGAGGAEEFSDPVVFYNSHPNLTPPPGDEQYSPGAIFGKTINFWQPPKSIEKRFDKAVFRQYARELLLHEFIHSVFDEKKPNQFKTENDTKNYHDIMREFHQVCLEEPESATIYSELYKPLITKDYKEGDYWFNQALKEELGELISSKILGWGAAPIKKGSMLLGEPRIFSERYFGGKQKGEKGKSKKEEFIEKLLRTEIIVPESKKIVEEHKVEDVTTHKTDHGGDKTHEHVVTANHEVKHVEVKHVDPSHH